MQAKITLIRTPAVLPLTSITAQQGVPSLALAYLSSHLKKNNFLVDCIDAIGEKIGTYSHFGTQGLLAAGLPLTEILNRIAPDTNYIGVSCQFSNDWIFAKKLLIQINSKYPQVPIFVGGEHTSSEYETILKECPFLKACVIGEGEETIVDLLTALQNKNNMSDVGGIAYIENTNLRKTPPRKRIKNINDIPWPDWDNLPLENYLTAGLGMAAQGIRSLPVLASRGCPYRCTFCSAPQMWDAKWVSRDVHDVISEIKFNIKKYRIDHIEFYDMSPSINIKWLKKLVAELKPLNISWNFPSGMRSENLDPDFITEMKNSGCYKLTYAIETSAPAIIKMIKKKVNPYRCLSLIRHSVKAGLITKVNFIWGMEGQRKRDILIDYLFIIKLALAGLHDATCFAFVPYPGSEDYNRLKKTGKIPLETEAYEKFLAFNVYNNPFKMKSWSKKIKNWQMTYWTLFGMALFYSIQFILRPVRIYYLFKRVLNKKPQTMLELAFFSLIQNFIVGKKTSRKIAQNIEQVA